MHRQATRAPPLPWPGSSAGRAVSVRPRSRSSMSRRDAAKNSARADSSPSSFEGPQLAVNRLQIERFAGDLQPPQVCLQPGVGIEDVGRDFIELGRQRAADVELVGSPVRGQSGVEAVGHQFRRAPPSAHAPRPRRRTGPRAASARHRPSSGRALRRAGHGSRRLSYGPARHTAGPANCPARSRTRRPRPRRGARVHASSRRLGAAARGGLVVQACRDLSSTGRASGVGTVEEIADCGRARHHTSS